VAVDRARIRLLLRNLLDNALRHDPDGAPPVELRTERDGDLLRLTVRDHGPGVPEDQLARLGEAFHRTDAARQRETGGVGLGLYLCRLVAQAHGGRLELRNAAPGLEAVVSLPLD
jgi:signal transduction histidine kinase